MRRCSFCEVEQPEALVVQGAKAAICHGCVAVCWDLMPLPAGCETPGEALAAERARSAEAQRWASLGWKLREDGEGP